MAVAFDDRSDCGMGKRDGEKTVEGPRGYRHHYQHGQRVRDIVVEVGSSEIGNVSVIDVEKKVIGVGLYMTMTTKPMTHIAATDYGYVVEDVDHSTIHRYQEPMSPQVDDAPLKL